MSYSNLKAAWHTGKIRQMREGKQIVPAQIQLVISDLCNHDCSFCAYRMSGYTSNQNFGEATEAGFTNNPNRRIPADKCKEILGDAAAMGVGAVQFTGGGEPTVHRDHLGIFGFAMSRGLDASLVTNGARLSNGWADVLPRMSWIRISVDAGVDSTYAEIRRIKPEVMHKVLANIESLRTEIDTQRTDCVLGTSFIITKENYREIAQAAEVLRSAGAPSVRFAAIFSPEEERYYDGIVEPILAGLADAKSQSFDDFEVIDMFSQRYKDLRDKAPDYDFCGYQEFNVYIGGDLNVYRCCNTAYNDRGLVGSIKDQSFLQFWHSAAKAEAYGGFCARGCERCAFNSQNKVINYMVQAEPTHVNFV